MKQLIVPMALVAGVLSACGGGGGGGGSSSGASAANPVAGVTAPVAQPPAVFQNPRHSVNDFESVFVTPLTSAGPLTPAYWATTVTTKVNPDNSYTQARVWSSNTPRGYYDFDPDGADATLDTTCHYTPAYIRVPGSLTLGQSWNNSAVVSCDDIPSYRSERNTKGSVVAIEPLTVLAGTFNTIKTVRTETSKFATSSTVKEYTCWRDTVTGLELKCNVSSTTTAVGADAAVTKSSSTWETGGFSVASTGRQKLNAERYAGKWQVWFTGTSEGICDVRIDTGGAISGNCTNNYGQGFGIAGSVAANGTAKFNLTESGASGPGFSGSFESPLKIAGTWSAGTDNGTWYMLHL